MSRHHTPANLGVWHPALNAAAYALEEEQYTGRPSRDTMSLLREVWRLQQRRTILRDRHVLPRLGQLLADRWGCSAKEARLRWIRGQVS